MTAELCDKHGLLNEGGNKVKVDLADVKGENAYAVFGRCLDAVKDSGASQEDYDRIQRILKGEEAFQGITVDSYEGIFTMADRIFKV